MSDDEKNWMNLSDNMILIIGMAICFVTSFILFYILYNLIVP
jgi:hypothetical protein